MSMAKSKALNEAEYRLRETAEAACVVLGLDPKATLWGGGLPGSFASKVLMLAAVPPQSTSSNEMRRHLMEFMPELPPTRECEARHEGPNPAKASKRKITPVDG